MKNFKLSVIIPTYNEEENIEKCLTSLLQQSYKNFEVIVVDDGSTDKTKDIVKSIEKTNKNIKLLGGAHKGPGFSRNLGAKNADGKIFIFVDADMTFDKEYLNELIKPILDGKTIGTEDGKQIALNTKNVWSRCWGTFFKDYINPETGQIFRAILRSEFEKMGGFDPSLGYADDLTFFIKYGVTSIRVPKAICYHKNPETLKEVYKQSKWIGASIQNKIFLIPLLAHISPLLMILFAPLAIPYLSIKKCYQNKDFGILFPWMFIFMAARYFGTISGIFRRVYLGKNVR